MTTKRQPKRLIEVDLPIREISSRAREESAAKRGGHLSTLHIWWARRPLAACRAVLCGCIWFDPADEQCPEAFRSAVAASLGTFAENVRRDRSLGETCATHRSRWSITDYGRMSLEDPSTWMDLRLALLAFIADFADFEASVRPEFIDTARAITAAAHEAMPGNAGERPLVHDPFAGGGAMPLEALRIGTAAVASDVNPVASLIQRVALEYAPRFRSQLVKEVRKWGELAKAALSEELSMYFPPDPDGAVPLAYLWARTIRCEGPGCGREIPILRTTLLSTKRGSEVGIRLAYSSSKLVTEVVHGRSASACGPGTNRRSSVTCPAPDCGFTTARVAVERQAKARGFGMHLLAVCIRREGKSRYYRQPTPRDLKVIALAREAADTLRTQEIKGVPVVPNDELPYLRSIFNVRVYGIDRWSKMFTDRQLVAAAALVKVVRRLDGELATSISNELLHRAIISSLALAASNTLQYLTTITTYPNERAGFKSAFIQGQSLPMKMDFAEVNPLIEGPAGGFAFTLNQHVAALEYLTKVSSEPGTVLKASALERNFPDGHFDLIATDPPYYDMIPYADCSDFFYVWLRRMLPDAGGNFAADLVDKGEEIVQLAERNERYRHKTKEWFEGRMRDALLNARQSLRDDSVALIVFAHKETAAWEALLQSVLDAGWVITASWPIDTENPSRMRASDSAVLSSSIHLVCRPRGGMQLRDHVGAWRDVLAELPARIHDWMPRLAREGVVGADAIFACLGPALEIFSRFERVEKASGEPVLLNKYLEEVWAAVAREALSMMFDGADASGLEEDARLTAMWLWTLGAGASAATAGSSAEEGDPDNESTATKALSGFVLEFDAARKIAQGLGAHLEKLTDVVEVKGDTARLLGVGERAKRLFSKRAASTGDAPQKPKAASKKQLGLFAEVEAAAKEGLLGKYAVPQLGETTLDRVHQAMILFDAGRSDSLRRFVVEEGAGQDPRFWRLAQSLSALYPGGASEKRWIDGVLARKKSLGF